MDLAPIAKANSGPQCLHALGRRSFLPRRPLANFAPPRSETCDSPRLADPVCASLQPAATSLGNARLLDTRRLLLAGSCSAFQTCCPLPQAQRGRLAGLSGGRKVATLAWRASRVNAAPRWLKVQGLAKSKFCAEPQETRAKVPSPKFPCPAIAAE